MDLAFSPQQEMLRKSVREFLQRNCDRKTVRELEASAPGYSPDLWRQMAALGWLGILVPERHGGQGGTFTDLVVLLEEFGRNPYPSPFQTAVVQCGLALLELGSEAQQRELLPAIARGELRCSLALTEASASYDPAQIETRAFARGQGFAISGTKLFVQYAGGADRFLVVARTDLTPGPSPDPAAGTPSPRRGEEDLTPGPSPDPPAMTPSPRRGEEGTGLSLFLVDARAKGVGITPLKTMAEDKQCEVVLNQVAVSRDALVGPLHGAWPGMRKVLALSALALAAEMAGGTQAALEYAVEYTKKRIQFGRPIASFQAIQHYAATMFMDSDSARYTVYEAASRFDAGQPWELEAAEAKALGNEVYLRVTAQGHQMLGGIGFYKDMDMQLWYRRAKAMEHLLGDAEYHRERIAQLMGL